MDDFLHDIPRRLLIPDETLKTREMNQKKLTNPPRGVSEYGNENWRAVAVTLEKNVAIVVMFRPRDFAMHKCRARYLARALLSRGAVLRGANESIEK